jgi:hypothetical protein
MNLARIGILVQKGPGGHENSGRAKATLYGTVLNKGLLQWIEPTFRHMQAFDRQNF